MHIFSSSPIKLCLARCCFSPIPLIASVFTLFHLSQQAKGSCLADSHNQKTLRTSNPAPVNSLFLLLNRYITLYLTNIKYIWVTFILSLDVCIYRHVYHEHLHVNLWVGTESVVLNISLYIILYISTHRHTFQCCFTFLKVWELVTS